MSCPIHFYWDEAPLLRATLIRDGEDSILSASHAVIDDGLL